MDESTVIAIFRREMALRDDNDRASIQDIAEESARQAIMHTFRLLGIKMNEDGMDSARTDFIFLHQLRTGSQYTRGIIFKTCLGALVTAFVTLLGAALFHEIQSILAAAPKGITPP